MKDTGLFSIPVFEPVSMGSESLTVDGLISYNVNSVTISLDRI